MAKVTKTDPWASFERAELKTVPRLIWMASGEAGTGKTRFGLTAPAPVLVQSLDKGLEWAVKPILQDMPDKEIYFREYDWDTEAEDFSQDYAIEVRDRIIADFMHGLNHARTIVWDKETDIREVFQYAEFGSPIEGNIKDYGKLNQRYFNLINKAKSVPGVNFGLIQAMKDEWIVSDAGVDNRTGKKKKAFSKSGRRIRAGFDRLDELVFAELHFEREKGEFFITVGKFPNGDYSDQQVPACTFAQLGTLCDPATSESDWE